MSSKFGDEIKYAFAYSKMSTVKVCWMIISNSIYNYCIANLIIYVYGIRFNQWQ